MAWSKLAWLASVLCIAAVHFFYYPKWQKPGTEATISWDVSGYYYYLPAFFIYQDARQLAWSDGIVARYQPSGSAYQAFRHEASGQQVFKYPAGMALLYAPFFALAHALAPSLGYAADGFSLPYQAAISWGSLLAAFLGLWWLRLALRPHFSEKSTAATLLLLSLGSIYLNYTAIDGAMPHNWLFSICAAVLWLSPKWHERPRWPLALALGGLIGLATLVRPTDVQFLLLALFWGVHDGASLRRRGSLLWEKRGQILLAGAALLAVAGLQLLYWKWAAGEWVVYSYQDQGFDFLSPHIKDGLISYRKGFLVYTPLMCFAFAGMVPLFRKWRAIAPTILAFSLLYMYVTFSWSIWWYGGGLGQRAMIQAFPVLAFPLAAFLQMLRPSRWWAWPLYAALAFCVAFNLNITHQSHLGGGFETEAMTKAYFKAIFMRRHIPEDWRRLLDTDELYRGTPKTQQPIAQWPGDRDSSAVLAAGRPAWRLAPDAPFSPAQGTALLPALGPDDWLRLSAELYTDSKDGHFWTMPQFTAQLWQGGALRKQRMIRPYRFMANGTWQRVDFDVRLPPEGADSLSLYFWNADSGSTLYIGSLAAARIE